MSVGDNIRMARKAKKITQQQLADLANLSRSYIADVERDRYNPSVDTLQNIASALDVRVSTLIGEEPEENQHETIAAHHDGEDWTEEELEEIERFKQFVKMRREQRSKE